MKIEELDTPAVIVDLDILDTEPAVLSQLLPEAWHWSAAAYQDAQDSCDCKDADRVRLPWDHGRKSRRSRGNGERGAERHPDCLSAVGRH